MLPALISSGSAAHGHSRRNACVSGRLRGPGPKCPSGGEIGSSKLSSWYEPRMEPDSAGAVHRIRDDQQRPRKPVRHIGTCGHRDTGAGIDDDATGPAYRAQQPFELGLGEVGDLGRVLQRERRDRGSERVDVLDRCVDAIA